VHEGSFDAGSLVEALSAPVAPVAPPRQ